ncbi:MAG TPA: undecaprenyl-diphosphate phosphatase [Candidatus Kapabacteria bacterium]|nr:undecaprenyl-diphosphate phosphatase [Candidatus Kapabacteria bacterium]
MPLSISLIAIILGVIEGLTEFLPVSSTGHLIVFDRLLGFQSMLQSAGKAELFEIVIQLGAILAIGVLYRKRLVDSLVSKSLETKAGRLRTNLFIAFLPAAIVGLITHHWITTYLFNPLTIGIALVLGGIIIIIIEKSTREDNREIVIDTMTTRDALVIGLAQTLSLIPGTSRAAATIIGGMLRGVKRAAATEFSFLLAFPVMIAASGYELMKYRHLLTHDMIGMIMLGFITSFVVALAVVAWFIRYVQRHPFTGFGFYRIFFGAIVIALWAAKVLV